MKVHALDILYKQTHTYTYTAIHTPTQSLESKNLTVVNKLKRGKVVDIMHDL